MPVSAIHTLSNYTVGGPSFTGTFSLEGMPQGAPLCNKMGALLRDGIFTNWVAGKAEVQNLLEREFTLVVQDNLLNLHVNGKIYTFKGAIQPMSETTTTAMLRSQLTETLSAPAKMQNEHLIPIIETAQSIFGQRARSVGYSQPREAESEAYRHMAQMHHDAQVTHRETVAAHERIIRDLIARGYTPADIPATIRESVSTFAPPRDVTAQFTELREKLARAEEDLASAKAQSDLLAEEKAGLSAQLTAALANKDKLASTLAAAEENLAQARTDQRAALEEHKEAKAALVSAQANLSQALASVKDLEAQLATAQDEHKETKAALASAQAEAKTSKASAALSERGLEETTTALSEARSTLANAQGQVAKLGEDLRTAQSANASPLADQNGYFATVHKLEIEAAAAKKESPTAQALSTRLQARVDELEAKASLAEESLATIQSEQKEEAFKLGAYQGEDFSEERKELEARLQMLAEQYQFLEVTHRAALLRSQDLSAQLKGFEAKKAEVTELTSLLEAQQTVIEASAAKISVLQPKLKAAEELNESLSAELSGIKERHEQVIKGIIAKHCAAIDKLQAELAKREGALAELESHYQYQLEELKGKLKAQCAERDERIATLNATLDSQEAELGSIREQHQHACAALIEEIRGKYEPQIKALEEQLESERHEYNSNIKRAAAKVQEALQEYKQTIERQGDEIAELTEWKRAMIERADVVWAQVNDQYRAYEEQIATLKAAASGTSSADQALMEAQASSIAALEQHNASLESLIESLEAQLKDQAARHYLDLDETFDEGVKAAEETTNAFVAEYRSKYTLSETQKEYAEKMVLQLKEQLAAAQAEAEAATSQVSALAEQAVTDRAAFEKLKASHEEKALILPLLENTVESQTLRVKQLKAALANVELARREAQGEIFAQASAHNQAIREKLAEIEELGSKLAQLEGALAKKDDELEAAARRAEHKEDFELQLEGVREEIEEQKVRILREAEAAKFEAEKEISALKAAHEVRLAILQAEANQREGTLDSLQATLHEEREARELNATALAEANKKLTQATSKIERQEKLHAALMQKYAELKTMDAEDTGRDKLEELREERSRLLGEKAQSLEELEGLKAERADHESVLQQNSQKILEARAKVTEAQRELAKAKEQLALRDEQIELLREGAGNEAVILLQKLDAERRAEEAETKLTALGSALMAASGPVNNPLIMQIYQQYEASLTGKRLEQQQPVALVS